MPTTDRRRSEAIDAWRGLAIILVVAGHAIQRTVVQFDASLVFRLIYTTHMPLFFFISGIVSAVSMRRSWRDLVTSRFLGLVVPYLMWGMLPSLGKVLTGDSVNIVAVVRDLVLVPSTAYWFLWLLFIFTLVGRLSFTGGTRPSRRILALLVVAGWLTSLLPTTAWGLEVVVLSRYYFPFYALGLGLSDRFLDREIRPLTGIRLRDMVSLAVPLLFALGWFRIEPTVLGRFWAEQGLPVPGAADMAYRYAAAMAGITASWLSIRYVLGFTRVRSWLVWFGRKTLEIYVGHPPFLPLFAGAGAVFAPASFVVSMLGALAIARVATSWPPTRVLFYGGRRWSGPGPFARARS